MAEALSHGCNGKDGGTATPKFIDYSIGFIAKLRSIPDRYNAVKRGFIGFKTIEELFSNMWDTEEAHEMLCPPLIPAEKSEDKSRELAHLGNQLLDERKLTKALETYNESLMAAPHPVIANAAMGQAECTSGYDQYEFPLINTERYGGVSHEESEALAIGFINRSAILMELNLPDNSLKDIEYAMQYNYPASFKYALEGRRKRCIAIKQKSLSKEPISPRLEKALDERTKRKKAPGQLPSYYESVLEALEKAIQPKESLTLEQLIDLSGRPSPELRNPSSTVPSFSKSLKVSYDPLKGRCVVAARNIRPGEILGIERPCATSIEERNLFIFCSTCLHYTANPLPCPGCTRVMFCSDRCRAKGLAEDHWLECKLLASLIALELTGIGAILKMLKTFSYDQLKDLIKQLRDQPPGDLAKSGFNSKGIFSSTSYCSIYHMFGDHYHLKGDTVFLQCQIAFALTKLLHKSARFFVDSAGRPITPTREDLIGAGTILLSHLVKGHYNLFQILDLPTDDHVGLGIYPAMSLINHSCDPSARHFTNARDMILRALKPLRPGEEVTIAYCLDFEEESQKERTIALNKYKFKCGCEACVNNWGLYNSLPLVIYKNTGEDLKTQRQNTEVVLRALSIGYRVETLVRTARKVTDEDFFNLCQSIQVLHTFLERPCQNICDLRLTMIMCFLDLTS